MAWHFCAILPGMIQIWGRKTAFNVQKVLWLLEELHVPYTLVPIGGPLGGNQTPSYLAMNPHGKVPVLQDEHGTIWESHTILNYVAAQYGSPLFWDPDPMIRAKIGEWMDWGQTALQPSFLNGIFFGYYRTPAEKRDWESIRFYMARVAKQFGILDQELQKSPYLGGDTLSLADIAVGTILYRYYELDLEKPSLPQVERWYALLQERQAFRDTVMVPFDFMFGDLPAFYTEP